MMENDIGTRIKDTRKSRGVTQEELGAKIGVTKATINKYETGIVVNLKRTVVEKIALALEVSPGYLMGWENTVNGVQVGSVQTNNGVIGHTNAPVTISNGSGPRALSKEEVELLRIYNQLDVRARMELLSAAITLEEKGERQEDM